MKEYKVDITAFVKALTRSYIEPKILLQTDKLISYDTDAGYICVDISEDKVLCIYTIDPDGEPFEQLYPPMF
jgi:hypothetical protein